METLIHHFREHFSHSDDIAYVDRRGLRTVRRSYRELGQLAEQWAERLSERNIAKGDRVLLWAENSAQWVAAFYGCVLRGAIVVPLDAGSESGFVARVQKQVDAKVLLAGNVREPERVFDGLIMPLETPSHSQAATTLSVQAEHVERDDLVEIIFTSGTTAEPRGVCLTHGNLLTNLAPLEKEIRNYLRLERWFHPVRLLNLVPLSHIFGQFMALLVPPVLKGEVHFQNVLNPGEVIETIKAERISVVVLVPRFLESLMEKVERELGNDLNGRSEVAFFRRVWRARRLHRRLGWKFWAFVSGGATLPTGTETFWHTQGYAVVQGYGMTETAALVSVVHPFKPKKGSIGKHLPGMEMKVGANGEILVRGENIATGVWDGTVKPLTDAEGWLHTGDLARADESGHLYFQGRQKDVIVTSAGVNIHPEDLEAALNRQDEIRSSAVIGMEGRQGPEAVAILLLRDPASEAATAVAKANQELSSHQHIRRWLIWPEADFPRTPTQKVRKPALAEWARSRVRNQDDGTSVIAMREDISPASTLRTLLSKVSGEVPSTLDKSLRLDSDLKLDSLGRVELLSLLEDHYQVELDEAGISTATTLGEVEDQLRAQWAEARTDAPVDAIVERQKSSKGERSVGAGSESLVQVAKAPPYPYPRWPLNRAVSWTRAVLWRCCILPLAQCLSRIQVSGIENLQSLNEPALFVSNHVTYADPGVVLAALPGVLRNHMAVAMDGERLRSWRYPATNENPIRRLGLVAFYYLALLTFNVFPLPQRSGFRKSFAFAGRAMDRGYNVLVFPEGQLTEDGKLQPFRRGIGLLADGLRAPVVPIRLDGLFELRQRRRKGFWALLLRPGRVSVICGTPLRLAIDEDPNVITRTLEQAIANLEKGR